MSGGALGSPETGARGRAWRSGSIGAALLLLVGYQALAHGRFVGRFFALDDFWILADADRAEGLLGLFSPSHGWLQYRPLTTVGYFALQRALFGLEPSGWQVVHLGALALNGLLVWAIARRLLGSESAALACALVHAAAPGHVLTARWLSLFTVTGVVTIVLAAVWTWLRLPPQRRWPPMMLLTLLGLLAGELSVVLAPVLTLLVLLVEPAGTRKRSLPALAAVWLPLLAAAGGKLWWGRTVFPREQPEEAEVFWQHYALSFDPMLALETLGRYLRAAWPPLALLGEDAATSRLLGVAVAVLAVVLAGSVVRPSAGRTLRTAAFGVGLFVTGIGPVLLMPQHFHSAYVGLAAVGAALASVAPLAALPRTAGVLAPLAAALLLAGLQVRVVLPRLLASTEVRLIDDTARGAAGWLRAIDAATARAPHIREVVLAETWATHLTFDRGEAHRIFLCGSYRVRTTRAPGAERPEPWRAVLLAPGRMSPPWPIRECVTPSALGPPGPTTPPGRAASSPPARAARAPASRRARWRRRCRRRSPSRRSARRA